MGPCRGCGPPFPPEASIHTGHKSKAASGNAAPHECANPPGKGMGNVKMNRNVEEVSKDQSGLTSHIFREPQRVN